jgi:MFS family permease
MAISIPRTERSAKKLSQVSAYARYQLDFSYHESVSLVLLFNAVGIPIRILLAFLADNHFGALHTFLPCLFAGALTFYCWLVIRSSGGIFVFTSVLGMAAGGIQTLFLAVLTSLATDPRTAGVRIGIVCTIVSFAALTGPPLGGAIIAADGGKYRWAEVWAGTSMMISFVILLAATIQKYLKGDNGKGDCSMRSHCQSTASS